MRISSCIATLSMSIAFTGTHAEAQSETDWKAMTNPGEVRQLVNGRVLDGKYWRHFYRSDGNMAYYHVDTDAMSVRKWKIEDDGELCVSVFQKPDRVIDCFTILQAAGNEAKYQLKWASGNSAFELLDNPPENMVEAVNDAAGPTQ